MRLPTPPPMMKAIATSSGPGCMRPVKRTKRRGEQSDRYEAVEDEVPHVRRKFGAEGEEGAGVLGVEEREDAACARG